MIKWHKIAIWETPINKKPHVKLLMLCGEMIMKSNLCMLPYITCTSHKTRSRLLGFVCRSSHRSQTGNSTRLWQRSPSFRRIKHGSQIAFMTQRTIKTLQLAYPNNMVKNLDCGWIHTTSSSLYPMSECGTCTFPWSLVRVKTIEGLFVWFDYLSLKKKVSPLICATASKITGSLQMSIGVTGPWVGGKGLSVGTPVYKRFTR